MKVLTGLLEKIRAKAPFDLPEIDRKAGVSMVVIVAGCLFMGIGSNLMFVHLGIVKTDSFEVDAVIQSCQRNSSCVVTYQRNGVTHTAIYAAVKTSFTAGTHVRATVYRHDPDRVYSDPPAPLGLVLASFLAGVVIAAVGCLKLYRHWRSPPHPDGDPAVDGSET